MSDVHGRCFHIAIGTSAPVAIAPIAARCRCHTALMSDSPIEDEPQSTDAAHDDPPAPEPKPRKAAKKFPSLKAGDLLSVLERKPLNYEIVRQAGSHRVMRAPNRPQILFSYHDGATVPPGLVRKILTRDVGLTDVEVWELLR